MKTTETSAKETLELFRGKYEDLNAICDELNKVVGMSPECRLYRSIWGMYDIVIEIIAEKIGVSYEALNWFVYENNFGRNHFNVSAGLGSERYTIDSIDAFLEFENKHK